MGLRELYNRLEDGYYSILDKIQRVIPIYSIIDPIDRVFPSFVLVLILLIAGIGGIAFWWFNQGPEQPTEQFAFLKIVDNENKALRNIDVTIVVGEQTLHLTTDPNGIVKVRLADQSAVDALVSVQADGFEEVNAQSVQLKLNQTTVIKLELIAVFEGPYVIKIMDSQTNTMIQGISVSVSFECEQSESAAPGQKVVTNGQAVVQKSPSCGTLYASFSPASGYQEKNHVEISLSSQTVSLDPIDSEPSVGSIEVSVEDEEGEPIEDAEISYRVSGSTGSPIAAGSTDSEGTLSIEELETGWYEVSAYNPADGRIAKKSSVHVSENDSVSVTLQFSALVNGKRIFFKVVDANTQQALSQVNVTAYDNSIKLGNTTVTNSQGIFEKNVDVNTNSSFSVVLYYPGYVLKVHFPTLVDENQTTPDSIALEKEKRDSYGQPLNFGSIEVRTLSEDLSLLPNTAVDLFRSNYPNPLRTVQTTSDANFRISGLEASSNFTYYATANSVQFDANGTSEQKTLGIAQTIQLPIVLITGTGSFKITAVDFDNPNTKIAGVHIRVFKVISTTGAQQTLSEGTTDSSGKWESSPIKINQNLFLEATATGRKRQLVGPLAFSTRNQVIEETVPLSVLETFPGDNCSLDADCSYPQSCNSSSKKCEQGCAENNDCQNLAGYYCTAGQLCQLPPQNYCDEQFSCSQSCQSCVNNQCTEPETETCSSNNDCCGLICDASLQQCRNPSGDACTNNADCGGNNFSCVSCGLDAYGQTVQCCKKACTENEECPAGSACTIEGYCEPLSPSNELKLSFEGIRGADPEDHVEQLLPGREFHAVFRLQLSRANDWNNLKMHFRLGPDSDAEGNDQNAFILNIYSIPGAKLDSDYPKYSLSTDLSNVYLNPETVNPGTNARQGNILYDRIQSQSDYVFMVKFKIRNGVKPTTPIPIFFQARGENNGRIFNTERHLQLLTANGSVCGTNCKPFLWSFFLNSPSGPVINPNQSVSLLDNQLGESAYKIFYTVQNTTTQDFLDSSLSVTTDRMDAITVKTNPVFSNERLSSQTMYEKGLINPIVFETKETSSTQYPNLKLELATVPSKNDSSAKPVIKLKVEPQAQLLLGLQVISNQKIKAVVKTNSLDQGERPVAGVLVRYSTNYAGSACTDSSINPTWSSGNCTTDSSGQCWLDGLSLSNSPVLVEASKNQYKKARTCQSIDSPTQTFGEPITCIRFRFSNDPNAGSYPDTLPEVTNYKRPTGSTPTMIGFSVQSECEFNVRVTASTLNIIKDSEVKVEGIENVSLSNGQTANGTISITKNSPLGFIPIKLLVEKENSETSSFIVGRARINADDKQFALVEVGD